MRQNECCKRIGRPLQIRLFPTEIDKFNNRKPYSNSRSPIIVPEMVRPPGRMFVTQHSQARHLVLANSGMAARPAHTTL